MLLRPSRAAEINNLEARGVQLFETWKAFGGEGFKERPLNDFVDYVQNGYQGNGVVFGVILARMSLFSEVSFAFQNKRDKRLFTTDALQILEEPWTNGSTGELVARMEQDGSLAGNAYVYKSPVTGKLQRLRPDWIQIISDGQEVVGYLYTVPGEEPRLLAAMDMAHWSPIPDPLGVHRGMSWLQPVVTEIQSDTGMTEHKRRFLKNAATPNLLVRAEGILPPGVKKELRQTLALRHEGVENAYRTLLLEGGADAKVLGANLKEIEFAVTQAAGENRIAVAAGVPAVVAGLKEGLNASTYSNYEQAMKRFASMTGHPNWRSMSQALERVVKVPQGTRLWYDTDGIPALAEDAQRQSDIDNKRALTIEALIRAGYTPESAVDAVVTSDMSKLTHTGLYSVQLQPPTPEQSSDSAASDEEDSTGDTENES